MARVLFSPANKILRKARTIANDCEKAKAKYRKMSNEELSGMTNIFIEKISKGYSLDDIIVDAFCTARETVFRVHGMFAFPVQIMGAAIVHFGDFAELYTGEGKTLVCVIAAYLNALQKKGVHIVTVNEYLAQRDAQFCRESLNPLFISVGCNLAQMPAGKKKEQFMCDITYTTNSELGFDYLRDNMVRRFEDKTMRELNFAIVDEGDSILIDEARTPLIISGQPKTNIALYIQVDKFAKILLPEDYKIDHESNSINLTDTGVVKAQTFFGIDNLFLISNSDLYHKIKNALMANYVFQHGVEYIVKEGEILLVDQFTGRILEGRSYNAGLQQAIQAKEYVKLEPENITVATITYQSLFRLYNKLSGLSGTAFTESDEFLKTYNMVVVKVPTNKTIVRKDLNDYVFSNKVSK
jgi:preprotein translocase subunit SecA